LLLVLIGQGLHRRFAIRRSTVADLLQRRRFHSRAILNEVESLRLPQLLIPIRQLVLVPLNEMHSFIAELDALQRHLRFVLVATRGTRQQLLLSEVVHPLQFYHVVLVRKIIQKLQFDLLLLLAGLDLGLAQVHIPRVSRYLGGHHYVGPVLHQRD
jgi:hypothetical protein